MKENQSEPRWKRIARDLFFLSVIASVVPLALAAYLEIQAHKAGTKQPTAEKTSNSSSKPAKNTSRPPNRSASA